MGTLALSHPQNMVQPHVDKNTATSTSQIFGNFDVKLAEEDLRQLNNSMRLELFNHIFYGSCGPEKLERYARSDKDDAFDLDPTMSCMAEAYNQDCQRNEMIDWGSDEGFDNEPLLDQTTHLLGKDLGIDWCYPSEPLMQDFIV